MGGLPPRNPSPLILPYIPAHHLSPTLHYLTSPHISLTRPPSFPIIKLTWHYMTLHNLTSCYINYNNLITPYSSTSSWVVKCWGDQYMKLSNICCVSTLIGDPLSIASCSESMHEPCVGLQYFRLRPACLRLINLVQFITPYITYNHLTSSYVTSSSIFLNYLK